MSKEENVVSESKGVSVVLAVDTHTHAGIKCKIGDKIIIGSHKKAEAMRAKGIIK